MNYSNDELRILATLNPNRVRSRDFARIERLDMIFMPSPSIKAFRVVLVRWLVVRGTIGCDVCGLRCAER